MSASTASACDAEPTLRAFILGSLELEDAPSLDPASPFPDLGRDIDETDLDLSGICAWLDAPPEPGVAPDAPRCASPERDDASFLRDFRGSLEEFLGDAPASDAEPRAAKRRRSFRESLAETTFGGTDTSAHETCFTELGKGEVPGRRVFSRRRGKAERREKRAVGAVTAEPSVGGGVSRAQARRRDRRPAPHGSRARESQRALVVRGAVRVRGERGAAVPAGIPAPEHRRERLADHGTSRVGGFRFPGRVSSRRADPVTRKPKRRSLQRSGGSIDRFPLCPSTMTSRRRRRRRSLVLSLETTFGTGYDRARSASRGGVRDAARKSRRAARGRGRPGVFFGTKRPRNVEGTTTQRLERMSRENVAFSESRDARLRALSAPRRAARLKTASEHSVARDVWSPRRSEYRRSRVCRADTHFASYPESTSSDRSRCVVTTPYLDGDT